MNTPYQILIQGRRQKRIQKRKAWEEQREISRFILKSNGMKIIIGYEEEPYFCDYRGRYVHDVVFLSGENKFLVSREWLLNNTTSWRDYTPNPLRWGVPEAGEAWSPEWIRRAFEEDVYPRLSAHELMLILKESNMEGKK